MNPSTLIGMVAGLAVLASVLLWSAHDPMLFLNLPGLAIVIGGTLAATFISFPLKEVLRVFKLLGTVVRNEKLYTQQDIDELVRISRLWIDGKLPQVERELEHVRNPFLRSGVQLVIELNPEEDIMDFLEWRVGRLGGRERAEARLGRVIA